ncbi:MAG TPA: hypothetical protein VM432_01335 [Bdellovibrionales bacterium]|nr:hypothetical protein [Bdellovibrionales bacterium]
MAMHRETNSQDTPEASSSMGDMRSQRRQETKESMTITGAGETSVEFHSSTIRREYIEGMDYDTTISTEMEFGFERPINKDH